MEIGDIKPAEDTGIFLSVVADVFAIQGRGCVILPGLPPPDTMVPVLRRGDPIMLRLPDGSELRTTIRDLEMINYRPNRRRPDPCFTPILLPNSITKADVPIGTELWFFGQSLSPKG